MICHDVIIVGAGLAGMRAVIEASKRVNTALVTKVYPTRSHSVGAQGGINAVLRPPDSIESHIYDTAKGGDYLGDQNAIEIFCQDAPSDIFVMERMGANFSRTPGGDIDQRELAGASYPRGVYAADLTGHKLMHLLYEQTLKSPVKIYNECFVTHIDVEDSRYRGILVYDLKRGEFQKMRSKALILATGGYGRCFGRTTNSYINTGDGMALALRAGSTLADMEFVQFHPTTLYGTNILVSEAVRGEGGYLRDAHGERFMARYTPQVMELAPRDVVSRCIQKEIREGRGIENEYVHLDVTHLGEARIRDRLPQVRDLAGKFSGVDILKEPMPVQPAQHYSMGGIRTSIWCETPIEGLFAAGECGCVSIHGANRLGGNSLMETVVFGRRAGIRAAEYARSHSLSPISSVSFKRAINRINRLLNQGGEERVSTIKNRLGQTMTQLVGVFRKKSELVTALKIIRDLKASFKRVTLNQKSLVYNTELKEAMELKSLLELSELIARGALLREESRGSHFREDFPKRNDKDWLKHTVFQRTEKGVEIGFEKVNITRYKPTERKY